MFDSLWPAFPDVLGTAKTLEVGTLDEESKQKHEGTTDRVDQ